MTTFPQAALLWSFWRQKRREWMGLVGLACLGAAGARCLDPSQHQQETLDVLGGMSMGLSLFVVFILCNISESNRRESSGLFPARLLTLPLSTSTLALAPILAGVLGLWIIYLFWAEALWPALGRVLPLGWPLLYLATAMACYQAVIWSLARLPKTRLMVLGTGGTLFAVGWIIFRDDFAAALAGPGWIGLPWREAWCGLLCLLLGLALALAVLAVDAQRRGGWRGLGWCRRMVPTFSSTLERFADRLAPAPRQPKSLRAVQVWFEWRRHGILLPLATLAILLVIMTTSVWFAPLNPDTTILIVSWVWCSPLVLAFAFGQGFGKADLWSKEPGTSVFFATRPLSIEDRIVAKMKAGLMASVAAWTIVIVLTPLWVCWAGDLQPFVELWATVTLFHPGPMAWLLPVLVLSSLVILTWRLLVGSLYVGFVAQNWLLAVAACSVFAIILGCPLIALALNQQPDLPRKFLRFPAWLPWMLAVLFSVRLGTAFILAVWAMQRRWVSARAVNQYLGGWILMTTVLGLTAWLSAPVHGWTRWSLLWVALMAMPLLRTSYAVIALARSRTR